MRKQFFLILFVFLRATIGFGQHAWKFRSDEYAGLDIGESGHYGTFQSVNGFYRGTWFLGLGVGLDYYRIRSVPLFVAVARDLPAFSKRSGLFLYVNGGVNLPWNNIPFQPDYLTLSSTWRAGLWGDGGLGYRWRISRQSQKALLVSAGYSVKKLTDNQTSQSSCQTFGICPLMGPANYAYAYMSRIFLIKIGFAF